MKQKKSILKVINDFSKIKQQNESKNINLKAINDIECDPETYSNHLLSKQQNQNGNRSLLYKLLKGTVIVGSVIGMVFVFTRNYNASFGQYPVLSSRQTLSEQSNHDEAAIDTRTEKEKAADKDWEVNLIEKGDNVKINTAEDSVDCNGVIGKVTDVWRNDDESFYRFRVILNEPCGVYQKDAGLEVPIYSLQLIDDEEAKKVADKELKLKPINVGNTVKIKGLKVAVECNDKTGEVTKQFREPKEIFYRFMVKLNEPCGIYQKGKEVGVRLSNLDLDKGPSTNYVRQKLRIFASHLPNVRFSKIFQ